MKSKNFLPKGGLSRRVVLLTACLAGLVSCALFETRVARNADLTEVRSEGGVLTTTLTAAPTKISLGGISLDGKTYNGLYTGPVLRVHPGDVMRIKLVNHLDENTNLHFHGLQTTPKGNSDNVHIVVGAGQSFDYEVPIPAFQPPGLYWYHAHIHHLAEEQVNGGLSGALIVEGIDGAILQLKGVPERLMVLKDYVQNESDDEVIPEQWHNRIVTINGRTDTEIALKPGETEFWRIGNHSADLPIRLSLPGHTFRVVSEDGVSRTNEVERSELELNPAARLEVLVTASDHAGTYPLQAVGIFTGTGANASKLRTLASVTVSGGAGATAAKLLSFPDRLDLRTQAITERRTVIFTQDNKAQRFFMDGKIFDAARTDTRVPLGAVEEWTIKNDTDDLHVFHIHQVHFQVVEINGVPQKFEAYADSYRVPSRGSIKIILPFTNPMIVGHFMYHCHVLDHEDRGMMAHIEVYDPLNTHALEDDVRSSICRPQTPTLQIGDVI